MEQSRFAELCYFCTYNKKLLEILNLRNLRDRSTDTTP